MTDIPVFERIDDYITFYGRTRPDAVAAVIDERRITYAELAAQIAALAAGLRAAGIGKGDRIAMLSPPHPDYLVCFMATASVGAIWVGLNPAYQLREIMTVLRDSTPRLLFARVRIGGRRFDTELQTIRSEIASIEAVVTVDEPLQGGVSMAQFLQAGADAAAELNAPTAAPCTSADPCLIVYTSGSTGTPKGAILHHGGLVGTSVEQNRVWPVDHLRTLNYFPINHVGCVADVTCPTIVAGGCIVFLEKFDTARSLELIERERISVLLSVPSVYHMQLEHPGFAQRDLSSVELIVWEGAAMPREMIQRLLGWCDLLATNYSLTESIGAVTVVPPTSDVDRLATTVGHPNRGVEVRLVDDDGHVVEGAGEGEIQSRSWFNMRGYWNNSDATAASLADGWLHTGDLAARDEQGAYRIVGRKREMYKSGGYNVYPREVEAVIEAVPGVGLVAVIGVPDPLWQEVGIAFVTADDGVTAAAIEDHCRRNLANYKIPKQIMIMPSLPLLPVGKVDKLALRSNWPARD